MTQLNLSLPTDTRVTRYATSEMIADAIGNRLLSIAQLLDCLKKSLADLGDQVQLNSTNALILSKLYSLEHFLAVELSKLTVTVPRQFGTRYEVDTTSRYRNLDLFLENLSKTSTPTQPTPWAMGQPSSSPCTSWERLDLGSWFQELQAPTSEKTDPAEVASKSDPEVVDSPDTEKS